MVKNKLSEDAFDFIQNMVDYRQNPCVVWDYQGNFIYANKRFCKLLKYTLDEVLEVPFIHLIYKVHIERSFAEYNVNKAVGGVTMIDGFYNRYYRKDGTLIWIKWHVAFNNKSLKMGSGEVSKVGWFKSLLLRLKYGK